MLFNSYPFLFVYLPLVFLGFFWLGQHSHRLAALWLAIASLVFYGIWDSRFVLLLLSSISFNYSAGYWIGLQATKEKEAGEAGKGFEKRRAKLTLIGAITANLLLLGYFKYANFFLDSGNALFGLQLPLADIILPLGISFFTFTQIAFLVDVYRGIAREYNFIHYLLFVTYFPHLIAGPVLHHKQMMPQFAQGTTYRIDWENVSVGLSIFILGLAKKVLIADSLAEEASPVFNAAADGEAPLLFAAWLGALAYTFQLYFDFSGYSDMAIGLSLMFNVRLPMNFHSPYKATSIIDFWRRWHMTLSAFLRDYLYIPLGGNRKGPVRRYVNLMLTMLLGGLWHGAGWTFVVWGGLHGLYLMLNHGWRELKARLGWGDGGRWARLGGGVLTFLAVVVGWVFFRAADFDTAWRVLEGMVGLNGFVEDEGEELLKTLLFAAIFVWLAPNVREMLQAWRPTWDDVAGKAPVSAAPNWLARRLTWQPSLPVAVLLGLVMAATLFNFSRTSEFLYFQF